MLLIAIVTQYSWIPDDLGQAWTRIYEVCFVPLLLIVIPIVVILILSAWLKMEQAWKKRTMEINQLPSKRAQIFNPIFVMVLFAMCILFGFLIQYFDVQLPVFVLSVVSSIIYALIGCVAVLCLRKAFPQCIPREIVTSQVAVAPAHAIRRRGSVYPMVIIEPPPN